MGLSVTQPIPRLSPLAHGPTHTAELPCPLIDLPAEASPPPPAAPTDAPPSETAELSPLPPRLPSEPPAPRVRARGTPGHDLAPNEQIRTLIYAPEATRAEWIEQELSHAPITIQIGRRVRTIVAALVRDPPPRPDVLIIDFDAVSRTDLAALHTIRQQGWFGRMIALGNVPPEICTSLGIDHVISMPLVRDSLLDCVAGTRHAAVTVACPVIPSDDEPK
jgi:hypothetical protein